MDMEFQSINGKPIHALSVDERLSLIDALWESIEDSQLPPLTAAQKEELDRRIALDDAGKAEYKTWEEVKLGLDKR